MRDLAYLKELYLLEPTASFTRYLIFNSNKKAEWLNKIENLKERIASDGEIYSYQRELLMRKINEYIEAVCPTNDLHDSHNNKDLGNKDLGRNIFSLGLVGLAGFGLGWAANDKYKDFLNERDRKLAELVMKMLKGDV